MVEPVQITKYYNTPFGKTLGLGDLTGTILANAVALAGVVFFFILLFGGVSIIMGAGQDDPAKVAQGKKAATVALIGFGIVFSTYWVLQIVSYLFGGNFFNLVTLP